MCSERTALLKELIRTVRLWGDIGRYFLIQFAVAFSEKCRNSCGNLNNATRPTTLFYDMQKFPFPCREVVAMKTVTNEPVSNEPTDTVYLADFIDCKSPEAFAELMRRHAGFVLATCQRRLGCGSEAEDAAQAVFILLWQQAMKLSRHSSVPGWLHVTACNVCRNSQRARAARLKHEQKAVKMSHQPADSSAAAWLEMREILDEEIERLPAKLRIPLILYHLESRGLKDVAAELNVSVSTVGTWLARARETLAAKLKRRGVTIGAVALGSLLTEHAIATDTPVGFVENTIQLAVNVAMEGAAGAGHSIAELVTPDARNLFLSKSFLACAATFSSIGAIVIILMWPAIKTHWSPDFPNLQGTWKEIADERDGGPHVVQNPIEHSSYMIISGRNFKRVQELPDGRRIASESGSILLNDDGKLHAIDFRMWQGSVLGIYELDEDQLVLCVGDSIRFDQVRSANSRPDDFVTVLGDNRRLTKYVRAR